ncbi:hypothetical protein HAX54_029642 [Datura stramonium]|uniref:Uncharacterized protein n=1 Tax=Datura stramonium TaxID=4076 RepID=A0ABS8SAD1_DATST|nr:hypothetical protein [Datura stramonium]
MFLHHRLCKSPLGARPHGLNAWAALKADIAAMPRPSMGQSLFVLKSTRLCGEENEECFISVDTSPRTLLKTVERGEPPKLDNFMFLVVSAATAVRSRLLPQGQNSLARVPSWGVVWAACSCAKSYTAVPRPDPSNSKSEWASPPGLSLVLIPFWPLYNISLKFAADSFEIFGFDFLLSRTFGNIERCLALWMCLKMGMQDMSKLLHPCSKLRKIWLDCWKDLDRLI